jgi:hypothetical protein
VSPPAEREVLAAIADVLIPAGDGMPAAGAVDTAGAELDRVLAARPDLAPALARIAGDVAGEAPEAAVRRLERERPGDLDTLLEALAGAYYLAAEVRDRLGYHGQEALTIDVYSDLEAYIEDGLLLPVIERGATYRATPRPGARTP